MSLPYSLPADFADDIAAIARIEAVPRLLRLLCDTTGMGFAAVARVTDERWIACAVDDGIGFGLPPGGELPVATTLCSEVRATDRSIFIDEASTDPVYCTHHTPRIYRIESYASVPIHLADGSYFGNLCAIDPSPHKVNDARTVAMFELFAQLIALQLDSDRVRDLAVAQRAAERAAGELREQFIAVLGHDLRNPLAAVAACSALLHKRPDDAALVTATARRIDRSTQRMSALIDDVLDFARGRLGGGIGMRVRETGDLGSRLAAVVAELGDAHPGRTIEARIAVEARVHCDASRIQQLASNLLGNALVHGAAGQPVRFGASLQGADLVIEVWNTGNPIARERLPNLFAPFRRRTAAHEGLGLGLYICAQIVAAHHGHLSATSSAQDGTTFTARLPVVR